MIVTTEGTNQMSEAGKPSMKRRDRMGSVVVALIFALTSQWSPAEDVKKRGSLKCNRAIWRITCYLLTMQTGMSIPWRPWCGSLATANLWVRPRLLYQDSTGFILMTSTICFLNSFSRVKLIHSSNLNIGNRKIFYIL